MQKSIRGGGVVQKSKENGKPQTDMALAVQEDAEAQHARLKHERLKDKSKAEAAARVHASRARDQGPMSAVESWLMGGCCGR